jgi:hypothetical protein
MSEHGQRQEDMGWGRILKFWPLLVAIFTAGAWYQSAKTNTEVTTILQLQTKEHEIRLTRVEDAVLYLKTIVERDENRRR